MFPYLRSMGDETNLSPQQQNGLILEYMRRFERELAAMRADLFDMREELQGINRRLSRMVEAQLDANCCLERLDERVSRIVRRLETLPA